MPSYLLRHPTALALAAATVAIDVAWHLVDFGQRVRDWLEGERWPLS